MADPTRIPDQLRENVWRGQVDAYRLQQYYGRLAGVRTRNVSMVMTLGCFVAFVGPHLDALGAPSSLEMLVSLVGVVVAVGTIAQGHNRIVEALFRHQQFSDLHVEWTDLWQRVEDGMTKAGEARSRWRELARKALRPAPLRTGSTSACWTLPNKQPTHTTHGRSPLVSQRQPDPQGPPPPKPAPEKRQGGWPPPKKPPPPPPPRKD